MLRRAPATVSCWLALGAVAGLGCASHVVDPKPTLAFPEADGEIDVLGELAAMLEVTARLERTGIAHPPLRELVDLEIAAMEAHVRARGRGTLDTSWRTAPQPAAIQQARALFENELERLAVAGVQLAPYLGLQEGPRELGRVALNALGRRLGPDAAIMSTDDEPADAGDLALEQRDGIGYLGLRRLVDDVADRAGAVLSQWAAAEQPLRALVLDLSRCEQATPDSANGLVQTFAPGRVAFEIELLDGKTRQRARRSYRGEPAFGSRAYAQTPLFVVTSARTGSFAEAVARALRRHRSAVVLGAAPIGEGRLMSWVTLPWNASFGFTVGELFDADGEAVRGTLLVPDACMSQGQLIAVPARAAAEYHARCNAAEQVPGTLAIDYVRSTLPATPAPAPIASPGGKPKA